MEEGMAQRIKALRLEKGLTLEQIAEVVGVGRSTVRKWETGIIANMRSDKIADLAKALGTSPAYLMGWDEEETKKENSLTGTELTEGELKLIELFRNVPEDRRELVFQMIDAALNSI